MAKSPSLCIAILLAFFLIPFTSQASNFGIDTPGNMTELPISVNGVPGIDLVAPGTTATQLPSNKVSPPNVVITGYAQILASAVADTACPSPWPDRNK